MKLLINLSNHPATAWGEAQKAAAEQYGEVMDMAFPQVAPNATEEDIDTLAAEYVSKITELAKGHEVTVHIMGEMTLTYRIISELKHRGIRCVASTTERIVSTDEQGNKVSTFRFNQFRKY